VSALLMVRMVRRCLLILATTVAAVTGLGAASSY
jgi:hypothetical protein